MKKIVVFGGSTSATSINQQLAEYAGSLLSEQCEVIALNLKAYEMDNFCIQKMKSEGAPAQANAFLEALENADAYIISTSEHNRNITAAFKNTLDWASRINLKMFANKPMLLMSTSPGGYGGQNARKVFEMMAPMFEANVVALYALPKFNETFQDGKIIDPALQEELVAAINTFESHLA